MVWSIPRIARRAGISSRALRHDHDAGILLPSRVAASGLRHDDEA